MKYANIVFLQESEAIEAEKILLDEGKEKALQYLKQWDSGEYPDISDSPSYGSSDTVYRIREYIISYNPSLPYVGLEKIIKE